MRWYFDYISPYAYLQSTQLAQLQKLQAVECTPVLFAGLLKHWGNLGPAEVAPKRKWTFRDIAYLAHRDGIELTWPAEHPFNPLPLLRLGIIHNNSVEVVQRLFRFVWAEGNLPQDDQAFAKLLAELNTKPQELQAENVKAQLMANGTLAINQGVFGVPSIEIDNDIFWGYSATEMAASYLADDGSYPHSMITSADTLPEGANRQTRTTPKTSANSKPVVAKPDGPRIPLKPIDLAEPADLVAAIRKRRGGQLIELDRLLLYSQPLSEGWNHFIGNIRQHFSVPQVLRELAMCTVAVLNDAEYEYSQHAPLYIKAGGSDEKAALIRHPDTAITNTAFSGEEQLTIALTIQLTRDVRIDDELFERAVQHFGNEHLVELIATIAAYNMVSRFLIAFELHP